MAVSKLRPLIDSLALLSTLPLVPFLRPGKEPADIQAPEEARWALQVGLGGAVRFGPGAEQPGNLLSSKLILLRDSRTREAEPQAHPRHLGSL